MYLQLDFILLNGIELLLFWLMMESAI